MYNIVMLKDFTSAGVSTVTVRQALNCCLLRLGRGMYSIISTCSRPEHRRIARFVDDPEWIDFHATHSTSSLADDFDYRDLLLRIRTISYPRYRDRDVLSGVSAAAIHELPMFGIELHRPITVFHPTSNSRSRGLIRRKRELNPIDTDRFDNLQVTSAIRTSYDLIPELGQRSAFAALESTLRTSLIGRDSPAWLKFGYSDDFDETARARIIREFHPVIERLSRGNVTAQRMTQAINPRSESLAESFCSFNLHALRLTGFVQQIKYYDDQGYIQRVDFADEERMVIIEVDGIGKSVQGGRTQVSRQSYQHNRLLALGFTVVRFRFSELLNLHTFATKLYAQAPGLRRVSVSV